ncbi:MAG: hypothetical protein LBI84_04470 [Propionibacteriaceae bacterium]|nr:hypothetical protein [Propionibacteriaceae bacterium]
MTRRSARLLALAWALALVAAPGASLPAAAAPAPQGTACDGVWVVVDASYFGAGVSSRCAVSYGSGAEALQSAGFAIDLSNGFLNRIDGRPGQPDPFTAYWSYWHSNRLADGSYGGWSYSNLGAAGYRPAKDSAEGWRFVPAGGTANPPGAQPPTNPDPPPPPAPEPPPAPPAAAQPPAGNQNSGNQHSGNQGAGAGQGSANQGSNNQNSGNQGSDKQGSANQNAGEPGSDGQPADGQDAAGQAGPPILEPSGETTASAGPSKTVSPSVSPSPRPGPVASPSPAAAAPEGHGEAAVLGLMAAALAIIAAAATGAAAWLRRRPV